MKYLNGIHKDKSFILCILKSYLYSPVCIPLVNRGVMFEAFDVCTVHIRIFIFGKWLSNNFNRRNVIWVFFNWILVISVHVVMWSCQHKIICKFSDRFKVCINRHYIWPHTSAGMPHLCISSAVKLSNVKCS